MEHNSIQRKRLLATQYLASLTVLTSLLRHSLPYVTVFNLFDSHEVSSPIPFFPSGRDPVLSRQHESNGRLCIKGSEGETVAD